MARNNPITFLFAARSAVVACFSSSTVRPVTARRSSNGFQVNATPSQVEAAKMTNPLVWLSDEAHSHGWTLLSRHRDARITYVLVDEHGEMEFDTLNDVEQEMRNMCRIHRLPPLRG